MVLKIFFIPWVIPESDSFLGVKFVLVVEVVMVVEVILVEVVLVVEVILVVEVVVVVEIVLVEVVLAVVVLEILEIGAVLVSTPAFCHIVACSLAKGAELAPVG